MYYLFENISDFNRKKLLNSIQIITKSYKKGEIVFKENDLCEAICFIKKGRIIAKNIFTDGHEIIVRTLNRFDSFGEGLIFSDNPLYKATFIVVDDCKLQFILKKDLISLMNLNSQISLNIFKHLNNQSFIQMAHLKLLTLKKVSSKVASYFYLNYKNLGKEFLLTLNKTEIAQYLNIERPTFSKELNNLIKNNIISYSHKKYTIIKPEDLIKRI